ncbi:hypothetical protein LIA77_00086 [Sarocladium implicatum]|nr:hypothetical protein LIA77_00086 [Sarocladium implicatum]
MPQPCVASTQYTSNVGHFTTWRHMKVSTVQLGKQWPWTRGIVNRGSRRSSISRPPTIHLMDPTLGSVNIYYAPDPDLNLLRQTELDPMQNVIMQHSVPFAIDAEPTCLLTTPARK